MKKDGASKYFLWGVFFLIVLVAVILRLQALFAKQLGHDEIISLLMCNGIVYDQFWEVIPDTPQPVSAFRQVFLNKNSGIKDFFRAFASPPTSEECMAHYYNPHPPFYFLLLRYYLRLFPSLNRIVLILPGFAGGLITLLLFGFLLREISSPQSAMLGMVFMAVSKTFVDIPTSLRTHNIWPVLILLGMILVVRYWKAESGKKQIMYAFAFGCTALLSLYTIYFAYKIYIFMLAFVFLNGGFLAEQRKKSFLILSLSGLIALLYYPWLKIALLHRLHQNMSAWADRSPFQLRFFHQLIGSLRTSIGFIGLFEFRFETRLTQLWALIITALIAYCLGVVLKKASAREKKFILALLFVMALQVAIRAILRFGGWYLIPGYNLFLGLSVFSVISIGIKNMRGMGKWVIVSFLIVSMLSVSVFNVGALFYKGEKWKMNFQDVCQLVKSQSPMNSLVIVGSNYPGWAGLVFIDLLDTNLSLWIAKREAQLSKLEDRAIDLSPFKQIWYIDHSLWSTPLGREQSANFLKELERELGRTPEKIKARETLTLYRWGS